MQIVVDAFVSTNVWNCGAFNRYRSQIEEALEQRKKREEEERQRQKQADTTSDEGVLSTEELDQQLPSDARRHSE